MAITATRLRFTRDEEIALHARMLAGDLEAKELLAQSMIGFAKRAAIRIAGRRIDIEELEGLAGMGLAMAINAWQPERARLITCAYWWVRNEVSRYLRSHCGSVYVPEHVDKTSPYFEQAKVARSKPVSLLAPVDGDSRLTLGAILASDIAEPWREMSIEQDRKQLRNRLSKALDRLGNSRTKKIMLALYSGTTTTELGIELGISQQRISQIRNVAIDRLREILEESECLVA